GWDAWAIAQMKVLTAQDRLFPGRDHLHTAVYRYEFEERAEGGPFAALALDRDFAGVVAVAIDGDDLEAARTWCARLARREMPVVAAFTQQRLIMSVLEGAPSAEHEGSAGSTSATHILVLGFVDGDVLAVWRDHVEPLLAEVPVGFASPFLRTIPGTDDYVDEL
ncbi:MAG: hypothetical protein JWL83_2025, partial [Actinomycetia bacterium]|nr:hypothetical protein [Actinomycetes bacterium]